MGGFVLSLALFPLLGVAFFPRTDPGQFVINLKAPTGSRLEVTNAYVGQVEKDIRDVIPQDDLKMIVSNIGVNADLSAIYTSNSAQHTAFVQVSLKEDHKLSTFSYMNRVTTEAGLGPARGLNLLPDWRTGGFRGQRRHAGANRHSSNRQQSTCRLQCCGRHCEPRAQLARRE